MNLFRARPTGRLAAFLLVAACGVFPAQAGLFHDFQGPYPYQNHIDLASPFSFVGAVYWTDQFGVERHQSGVALAGNKILATEHGLRDDLGQYGTNYRFVVGADTLNNPIEAIDVTGWVTHPDYTGIGGPGDLAVLTMEDALATVDPISLFDGEFVLGTQVTMVGYGRPGTVSEGYGDWDGIRRASIVYPDQYGGGAWFDDYLSGEFDSEGGPYYHALGAMATPGDSGGGWFIESNGNMELLGLTAINNGLYWAGAGRTGAIRLDDYNGYRDWVIANIPEPATASMLLFACGMLACRRKRAA